MTRTGRPAAALAAMLAVLLLAQWGGAAASCLAALRVLPLAGAMCHTDGGPGPDRHPSGHDPACAHCAPLPPALAAAPPVLPPSRASVFASMAFLPPAASAVRAAVASYQPRGPPTPA